MANVLLFGPLAGVLDTGSIEVEIDEQTQTIHDLITELSSKGSQWKHNLSPEKLQITVNRQFADVNTSIKNSDEIAFIPLPGTI